jgi:SAM-dependent methyltransferase
MTQVTPEVKDHAFEHFSDQDAKDIEDRLWWMQGRKDIIRCYLKLAIGKLSNPRIMDVGCGSGGNLGVLSEFGKVTGLEPSPILARRSRERGVAEAVFEEDVGTLDATKEVDVFTMFDVLEHIESDMQFISSIKRQACQPHRLLISVPACPQLYGEHDRILHHYRRYDRRMLRSLLEENGYEVEQLSYHMTLLFPLAMAARVKDKVCQVFGSKRDQIELGDVPPALSKVLGAMLAAEARFVGRMTLPFGLWLFAVAKSKENEHV